MKSMEISFGHASWHSPWSVQEPKNSSIVSTIAAVRCQRSGWPWGSRLRCCIFAAVNSCAALLGQAATQAPHAMLAGGRAALGAVGLAVDHHPAAAADALAAVVLEGDRLAVGGDEPLVDDVEHLEEGHVGADPLRLLGVRDHLAGLARAGLTPDVQGEVHQALVPSGVLRA